MSRKITLSYKKNYERKRQERRQSKDQCIVSIPISVFTVTSFGSLCQLWSRLDTTRLPHGWLEHPDARLSNSLVLSSYRNNSLFLVTVNRHLECCVTCNGHDISQCNVLQSIPTHINNIQYLHELLDIITNCHLCCGNHLEQFHDVLSEEEKHATNTAIGKKTNYNKCIMNLHVASFHSILQDKTFLFINHVKSFCPAALNNNDVNHVPDSGQLCLSADLATTRQ